MRGCAAQVLVAPDRAKALALLSTAHPDLILVDVNGRSSNCSTRSALARGSRAGPIRIRR